MKNAVLEFFWSVFSHIQKEYGEILRISPYSVKIRENKDQKNSENDTFYAMIVILQHYINKISLLLQVLG